jgi:signal transduction histidine kinase
LPVLDERAELSGSVLTIVETTDHRRVLEDERLLRKHISEAEALRDEASKIASLEQLKSQFLRLASHELRSPFAIVKGYLSMLADGTLGELPDAARSALPVMGAKLLEMNLLIDQLLDTARLEDSRLALKMERFDLREVVEKAVASVRPIASRDHTIVLHKPEHPIEVTGDKPRLRMVVSNLVENAIKYSPHGGYIECSVGRWDGQATVTVSDNGIGIEPDQMNLLFTRFGRLVTRENEYIPGTGLGLFLARELARMHGGDLSAESAPGEGSVFTLRVPLAQSD